MHRLRVVGAALFLLSILGAAVSGLLLRADPAGARQEITIHAGTDARGSLYLEPDHIIVPAGSEVTLTVVNDDWEGSPRAQQTRAHQHDVVIHGLEGPRSGGRCPAVSQEDRQRAEGVELEVCTTPETSTTFTVPGTSDDLEFEMVCEVPGHADAGMQGDLVVTGTGPATIPAAGSLTGVLVLVCVPLATARRRR